MCDYFGYGQECNINCGILTTDAAAAPTTTSDPLGQIIGAGAAGSTGTTAPTEPLMVSSSFQLTLFQVPVESQIGSVLKDFFLMFIIIFGLAYLYKNSKKVVQKSQDLANSMHDHYDRMGDGCGGGSKDGYEKLI